MQTSDAIVPVPRILGWFDVAARVTYTSDDGVVTRSAFGTYLDAHQQEGPVFLGDGIEMLFHVLCLDLPRGEALHAFCAAVTAGLAEASSTTIAFGEGRFHIELADWQSVPGGLSDP